MLSANPERGEWIGKGASELTAVGWREDPQDETKTLRAFHNLVTHSLAPGGILIVTLPANFNPHLDAFVQSGRIRFQETYCLRRQPGESTWEEVPPKEAFNAGYDKRVPSANAVFVGILRKS